MSQQDKNRNGINLDGGFTGQRKKWYCDGCGQGHSPFVTAYLVDGMKFCEEQYNAYKQRYQKIMHQVEKK